MLVYKAEIKKKKKKWPEKKNIIIKNENEVYSLLTNVAVRSVCLADGVSLLPPFANYLHPQIMLSAFLSFFFFFFFLRFDYSDV